MGGGGTPYNGLCGRLRVKGVGISQVEVHGYERTERIGKSVKGFELKYFEQMHLRAVSFQFLGTA